MTRLDPFTPYILWASPDYVPPANPDPLYAHEHEALLVQCRTMLERRLAQYPAMIERGAITREEAKADIAAWRRLVAEWEWIEGGVGLPPLSYSLPARIAAVNLAMVRVDQELARGNRGYDILRQSHLIEALRWHLLNIVEGEPMIHRCARFNHKARAAQGKRWCAACDRWQTDPERSACTSPRCTMPRERAA